MNYKINKYISSTFTKSYAKDGDDNIYPIKIDCYEGVNTLTFPPNALETINNIDYTIIKDYPHGDDIKYAIINYWNSNNSSNIEIDNISLCEGSINGIYLMNRLFLEVNDKILGCVPQFPEYGIDVQMYGAKFDCYKLKKENNYKFIVEEFMECMNEDYKLIYIDNPNNPTGQVIDLSSIEKILIKAKKLGSIVLIDEAYGEYMDKYNSAINLVNKYDNVVVLKTFSKGFALAGIRAGYLIAPKELNRVLKKITHPYLINGLGRKIGKSVLEDYNFILETLDKNRYIKRHFMKQWKNLIIGETNDVVSIFLLEHKNKNVNLKEEFARLGIGVVCGSTFETLDKSYVRISIPDYDDLDEVLSAFEKIDNL